MVAGDVSYFIVCVMPQHLIFSYPQNFHCQSAISAREKINFIVRSNLSKYEIGLLFLDRIEKGVKNDSAWFYCVFAGFCG